MDERKSVAQLVSSHGAGKQPLGEGSVWAFQREHRGQYSKERDRKERGIQKCKRASAMLHGHSSVSDCTQTGFLGGKREKFLYPQ